MVQSDIKIDTNKQTKKKNKNRFDNNQLLMIPPASFYIIKRKGEGRGNQCTNVHVINGTNR